MLFDGFSKSTPLGSLNFNSPDEEREKTVSEKLGSLQLQLKSPDVSSVADKIAIFCWDSGKSYKELDIRLGGSFTGFT